MPLNIRVLFFGATASDVGNRQMEISVPDRSTVGMAFDQLANDFPILSGRKLLYAINETYVTANEVLGDGDEFGDLYKCLGRIRSKADETMVLPHQ